MSYPVRVWSTAYSSLSETEGYNIHMEKDLWQKIIQQEGSKRKFLKIEHTEGLPDWFAPLGQPVAQDYHHSESKEEPYYNIYMPLWMLDAAHFRGEGEETVLEAMDEEYFPQASHITLRVIDSAFYNADVKDELEKALSSMGVIQEHTTLQIPVSALEGYKVEVFVSKTEPANIVFCDGEEVALDFEEPVDQIHIPRPPTPIPALPPCFPQTNILPTEFVSSNTAFQGAGNVLGSSNAHVPDWRKQLGPPKRR